MSNQLQCANCGSRKFTLCNFTYPILYQPISTMSHYPKNIIKEKIGTLANICGKKIMCGHTHTLNDVGYSATSLKINNPNIRFRLLYSAERFGDTFCYHYPYKSSPGFKNGTVINIKDCERCRNENPDICSRVKHMDPSYYNIQATPWSNNELEIDKLLNIDKMDKNSLCETSLGPLLRDSSIYDVTVELSENNRNVEFSVYRKIIT